MSDLINQLYENLQKNEKADVLPDLPLFAAADAIYRRRKRIRKILIAASAACMAITASAMYFSDTHDFRFNDKNLLSASAIPSNDKTKKAALSDEKLLLTKAIEVQSVTDQRVEHSNVMDKSEEKFAEVSVIVSQQSVTAKEKKTIPIEKHVSAKSSGLQQKKSVEQKRARSDFFNDKEKQLESVKQPARNSAQLQDARLLSDANTVLASSGLRAAITVLQQGINLRKDLPDSTALLFAMQLEAGEAQFMTPLVHHYHQAFPLQKRFSVFLSRYYIMTKQDEAARDLFASMPVSLANDSEILELRATTLHNLGDYQASADIYQQLLKTDEHNGRWWMGLAVASDAGNDLPRAKTAYRFAIASGQLSVELQRYANQRLNTIL